MAVQPESKLGKLKRFKNRTKAVVNIGPIRFMPSGSPGDTIEIHEVKIPEGMKRLIGGTLQELE